MEPPPILYEAYVNPLGRPFFAWITREHAETHVNMHGIARIFTYGRYRVGPCDRIFTYGRYRVGSRNRLECLVNHGRSTHRTRNIAVWSQNIHKA